MSKNKDEIQEILDKINNTPAEDLVERNKYTIEITPVPDSQGGGFAARLPYFDQHVIGYGFTETKAIENMKEVQLKVFKEALKHGGTILSEFP